MAHVCLGDALCKTILLKLALSRDELIKIVTSYETDYSLNLSILLSEGKETNRDFFCSGERTRKLSEI